MARPGLDLQGRLGVALGAAVLLLAVGEAVGALVVPALAPTDQDWGAAAAWVRAQHQDRDLIVTAPSWADPVLRQHLGDLIPPAMAGRLDHLGYARVWEISQRGADAPETTGARVEAERRFGRLRVRLARRDALVPRYDFVDSWAAARVSRVEPGRVVPCELQPAQHQCPNLGFNFVKSRILEIGNSLRRALYAQPVANATVVLEWPEVPLGRELAIGAGLHNVWLRKGGDGTVWLRVLVAGQEVGKLESGNRTGWKVARLDTTAWAGRTAAVRFEISSARPFSRHFGFAAEARGQ